MAGRAKRRASGYELQWALECKSEHASPVQLLQDLLQRWQGQQLDAVIGAERTQQSAAQLRVGPLWHRTGWCSWQMFELSGC